jgi:hypothetical protein
MKINTCTPGWWRPERKFSLITKTSSEDIKQDKKKNLIFHIFPLCDKHYKRQRQGKQGVFLGGSGSYPESNS